MTPTSRDLLLLALGCACLGLACHSAPPPNAPVARAGATTLPVAALTAARKSCQAGSLPADILACVQGVAITRARFDAVRPGYPASVSNQAVLQALIDEELLESAALRKPQDEGMLERIQRQAMAAALLTTQLERKLGPAQIADDDIRKAYLNDSIREHYRHAPGYSVTDVQILCCSGGAEQCAQSPEVQTCIDKLEPEAREVYAALLADPPRSAMEMTARVTRMKAQRPALTVGPVQFYYDVNKPYDKQGGRYTLMVKEFIEHVTPLKPGELGKPFRSPFGWHITHMDEFRPAVNRPWNAPDVRKDIAEHIIDLVRNREGEKLLADLMQAAKVELFYDKLDVAAPQ